MDKLRCMLYSELSFVVSANSQFMAERKCSGVQCSSHSLRYYWGSINTHRYVIWRFARKIRGRCFAVNYRSEGTEGASSTNRQKHHSTRSRARFRTASRHTSTS